MIKIVTAFFNIGRNEWSGGFSRSDNEYISCFEKWARIKNELIVYVGDELIKERILAIRNSFGLKEKTEVIVISEIESLEPEIYKQIKKNVELQDQKIWRRNPHCPEVWNANYSYLMFLKNWFLADAVERSSINDDRIAWVDFGYAKPEYFNCPEDFDFLWNYEFPQDKIILFNLKEVSNRAIVDIINSMDTYIQGCVYLVPARKAQYFYNLTKRFFQSILDLGMVDDDQILLLMAQQFAPEIFELYPATWFQPLQKYGNNNLRMIPVAEDTILRNAAKHYYRTKLDIVYIWHLFKHINRIKVS